MPNDLDERCIDCFDLLNADGGCDRCDHFDDCPVCGAKNCANTLQEILGAN